MIKIILGTYCKNMRILGPRIHQLRSILSTAQNLSCENRQAQALRMEKPKSSTATRIEFYGLNLNSGSNES